MAEITLGANDVEPLIRNLEEHWGALERLLVKTRTVTTREATYPANNPANRPPQQVIDGWGLNLQRVVEALAIELEVTRNLIDWLDGRFRALEAEVRGHGRQ
jgi:hypothetical protein